MTKSQAKYIAKRYSGQIRENYSGRGMYGETTIGVVISGFDFDQFRKSRSKNKYCTDNMGLSFILY